MPFVSQARRPGVSWRQPAAQHFRGNVVERVQEIRAEARIVLDHREMPVLSEKYIRMYW
jgi:hypothetical protein